MSSKSVLQECQVRVLQECQVRVSNKSVRQECPSKMSNKSVKQECLTERCVSSKGVLQQWHPSVTSQGVQQVGSLEIVTNKYISVPQHTCRHSGSWVSSCFSKTIFVCVHRSNKHQQTSSKFSPHFRIKQFSPFLASNHRPKVKRSRYDSMAFLEDAQQQLELHGPRLLAAALVTRHRSRNMWKRQVDAPAMMWCFHTYVHHFHKYVHHHPNSENPHKETITKFVSNTSLSIVYVHGISLMGAKRTKISHDSLVLHSVSHWIFIHHQYFNHSLILASKRHHVE